jgi:formylglycine-generating enzyme required for sulfatase activity
MRHLDPNSLETCDPRRGDPVEFMRWAQELEAAGQLELAATAYDLAFGLTPENRDIREARRRTLDELSISVGPLEFRYIPAGCFLMGSLEGEPDERPVHLASVPAFWLSETPVSWAAYCEILGWAPPPLGLPVTETPSQMTEASREELPPDFFQQETNKIRLQYCEDGTAFAGDWHAHAGMDASLFGRTPRDDPRRPIRYDRKPMVAVSWQDAEAMCARLSEPGLLCRLPSETEWEKAARGALIGKRYPWGNDPPTAENCDCDHFGVFVIRPSRSLPPNDYGLFGMCGGVWEWTSSWYDAAGYEHEPATRPRDGAERVLRGGSWSDCVDAVTVSFRMSRAASEGGRGWGAQMTPNIGFRPCLVRDA